MLGVYNFSSDEIQTDFQEQGPACNCCYFIAMATCCAGYIAVLLHMYSVLFSVYKEFSVGEAFDDYFEVNGKSSFTIFISILVGSTL